MIAIVDYGAGNLRSVANAISRLGYQPNITSRPQDVLNARVVILPGVGAAASTMASLSALGLDAAIRQIVAEDRPLFAVCIGMQILFDSTEEGGQHACLGVLGGRVIRLPEGLKTPHMGWNQVKQKMSHPIFQGIPDGANVYFVHSYYVQPDDPSVVAGETEYGIKMCTVVARGNLVATQFHPEKSGDIGLKMYSNYLETHLGGEPGRWGSSGVGRG